MGFVLVPQPIEIGAHDTKSAFADYYLSPRRRTLLARAETLVSRLPLSRNQVKLNSIATFRSYDLTLVL
jgi:hypothetical protein